VIAAARANLGAAISRFVPAHPIAGTEHTGANAAFATLFRERNVVLTPIPETDFGATRTMRALWQRAGATVRELDAAQHDRIFAAVSHLPHVLAFTLVEELASRPDAQAFFDYAASGFRDFTRISASSPEMWRDIALANRGALLDEIATYRAGLDAMSRMIAEGDAEGLHAAFARASTARRAWGTARAADVPADGPREP
jgi:prephenate dehydrogenase